MNCKNITNSAKRYYQLAGIDNEAIIKTKDRMKFFLKVFTKITLAEETLHHIRGDKFSCIEDMLLREGQFFDSNIELVSPSMPLEKLFSLSKSVGRAYCEGFVLPWTGGTPIQAEWVFDSKTNTVITRETGMHFGIAFNPSYLIEEFSAAGHTNILMFDAKHEKIFLNNSFPKEALMDNQH